MYFTYFIFICHMCFIYLYMVSAHFMLQCKCFIWIKSKKINQKREDKKHQRVINICGNDCNFFVNGYNQIDKKAICSQESTNIT